MLDEASNGEFERAPVGKYTVTRSCVVWSASSSLVGWQVWGRPDEDEARAVLGMLAQYPKIGTAFDVIADTRAVESVPPPSLALLVRWVFEHRVELRRRVRVQANVIRRDSIGFLFTGIIASMGDLHAFRTYSDPVEAFQSVAGDEGATLAREIDAIAERARAVPHELIAVRSMLARNVSTSIDDAARALSTSPRSLQRLLQQHGTSFHDEQTEARFALTQALLDTGSDKLGSIAHRVGWSERTLTSIFRARTGLTPSDWRKRPR